MAWSCDLRTVGNGVIRRNCFSSDSLVCVATAVLPFSPLPVMVNAYNVPGLAAAGRVILRVVSFLPFAIDASSKFSPVASAVVSS